ncbi:MAG: VWA domain-containing protein [Deltaproteobacteria bacterium]|nr:VWA domain-containing protein [Deltaproteobacteria bacterium]
MHARKLRYGIVLVLASVAAACSATDNELDKESGSSGASGFGGGLSTGSNLGSGDGSTGAEMQCGKSTFGNEVPGALLLLLDKSGSMSDPASGNNGPSKWDATVSAVKKMVDAASPTLQVGLLPFPAGKFNSLLMQQCLIPIPGLPQPPNCPQILADGGCKDVDPQPVVPVVPLVEKAPAIVSWLNQNDPTGGTPTLHALKNAYAVMKAHPTPGQRFVLLVTDGVPNTAQPSVFPLPALQTDCGKLADIENEAAIAASGSPAVHTFVIGSPGSEDAAKSLSTIALNGKTPKSPGCSPAAGDCHYQIGSADFEAELAKVLAAIAGSVGDCVFAIPEGQDVDPNLVNVTVETGNGPQEVLKDASHADGWDYTDASQKKIQLFGPACEVYKTSKGGSITIILGCESKVK